MHVEGVLDCLVTNLDLIFLRLSIVESRAKNSPCAARTASYSVCAFLQSCFG